MKSRRVKRSKSKRKKMKRRSYSRTRVSLSKSRRSNKKRPPRKTRTRVSLSTRFLQLRIRRPRKIRVWKQSRSPESSYKRQVTPPKKPKVYAQKVYISETKNISKHYPEVLIDEYASKSYLSYIPFEDLYLYYPKTTGVYPNHPYIEQHGAIYRDYYYGWLWGSGFSIQSKDSVAMYDNNYYGKDYILTPPLKYGDGINIKNIETPYKCVHYGKRSALIDIGNMMYYRISIQEVGELFEPGYQITHFFSDIYDKVHCNVFWITSEGDLYIEYDTDYAEYGNLIPSGYFDKNDRKISPPIRIPEIQDPVSREQFLLKLLTMRQSQVTSFLRTLLDKTLFDYGIIDIMPSPLSISIPLEKDPLAYRNSLE